MQGLKNVGVGPEQAALWFIGQAGFVIRCAGVTVVIDPYLSDSVAKVAPDYARAYPPPILPEDLEADIFVVTHDHLDHLDPETIGPYRHKDTTLFVAPRLAAHKLKTLGVAAERTVVVNAGEARNVRGVSVTGVYAVPTGADVPDTTGYLVRFANGRSVYHASDTAFSPLLVRNTPRNPDVFLVPINGKFGNLKVEQAVALTAAVQPHIAIPCHYDVMKLNSADPSAFRAGVVEQNLAAQVMILGVMEPFIWGKPA